MIFLLRFIKTRPKIEGEKVRNLATAQYNRNSRNQRPFAFNEQPPNQKKDYNQQQKRESQANEGNQRPVLRINLGVDARQQKQQRGNHVDD